MRVTLQAQGLWNAVVDGTTDFTEDRMALEVISKAVPPEMLGSVATKETTKLAWDALKQRNIGVDRVRKAKASTLRREFDSLKFRDGESVDEFGTRITQLTNRLAVLGDDYTEEEIVRKFLQALPPRFDQIAASIETLLDLADVTVDELIGRLKAPEERLGQSGDDCPIAKLNLTEDELVVRLSSRLKMTGNGGSERGKESFSSSKRGRDRGRGRDKKSGGCGGRRKSWQWCLHPRQQRRGSRRVSLLR
jgi:hypothetical protein